MKRQETKKTGRRPSWSPPCRVSPELGSEFREVVGPRWTVESESFQIHYRAIPAFEAVGTGAAHAGAEHSGTAQEGAAHVAGSAGQQT